MAEMAREYHDNLQLDGDTPIEICNAATQEALGNISSVTFPAQKTTMAEFLTEEDVSAALKDSPNGKAAGINGLPTELWKSLKLAHINKKKQEKPAFNVIETLTHIYNDIERHGMIPETDFATGWMCPIYKKKGQD